MRIRIAVPDHMVTPEVIDAALEATTRANESMLAAGEAPLATDLLRRGVRWRPEPKHLQDGVEHFDLLPTMAVRGWGDCDDWAPGLAAELRHTGEDPGARAVIRRSGARRWHALVQGSDGEILDPSLWAGMPSRRPPLARRMARNGESMIALDHRADGWHSRCDLPAMQGHIVGTHIASTPWEAIVGAYGAVGLAHPDHAIVDRAGEYAHALGELAGQHVIGQFGDLLSMAMPIAKGALGGLMGGGKGGGGGGGGDAPAAAPAAAAPPSAAPALVSHQLPGGGSVTFGPGAPVVVRF